MVTRFAGGGSASGVASGAVDGVGSAAMFYNPRAISVDSVGNVYVADTSNHLIRTISPTGTRWMCLSVCVCSHLQSEVSCNLTKWFVQEW